MHYQELFFIFINLFENLCIFSWRRHKNFKMFKRAKKSKAPEIVPRDPISPEHVKDVAETIATVQIKPGYITKEQSYSKVKSLLNFEQREKVWNDIQSTLADFKVKVSECENDLDKLARLFMQRFISDIKTVVSTENMLKINIDDKDMFNYLHDRIWYFIAKNFEDFNDLIPIFEAHIDLMISSLFAKFFPEHHTMVDETRYKSILDLMNALQCGFSETPIYFFFMNYLQEESVKKTEVLDICKLIFESFGEIEETAKSATEVYSAITAFKWFE